MFCAITPKEGSLQEFPGVVSLFCYGLDIVVKREFGVENYAEILCRNYCFQDMIMNFILFGDVFLVLSGDSQHQALLSSKLQGPVLFPNLQCV